MKTNTKINARVFFVLIILFVTFTTVAFVIPFPKRGVFWVAYSFEAVAIFLQFIVFRTAFGKGTSLKSRFLGYPIARVGCIYLAVQSVVTVILFILGAFIKNPLMIDIAIVICVIILGAAIVCGIAVDSAREAIEQLDRAVQIDTANMRILQAQSRAMIAMTDEAEIKKQLEQLADKFRFSDPVSAPELKEIEERLRSGLEGLKGMLRDHAEGIPQRIEYVSRTLEERNLLCKALK